MEIQGEKIAGTWVGKSDQDGEIRDHPAWSINGRRARVKAGRTVRGYCYNLDKR